MAEQTSGPAGPDLKAGIAESELADGAMLAGQVDGEAVLLARSGGEVFAVGATCTHYGGPLAEGLLVGDTVRCPWHHACFSLRDGRELRPPALAPLARWRVEQRDGRIRVTERIDAPLPPDTAPGASAGALRSIVIVGAGAAGAVAAQTLRDEGYEGELVLYAGDGYPPSDRPNLSKDYLAGTAPEEWIWLHPEEWYAERRIELVLGRRVVAIDPDARTVALDDGSRRSWDALLLATGAEPVRLGADVDPHHRVHYLRTPGDSRAIIAAALEARRAVVIGASFIGLETAASLRARGLEVHVVAPDERPLGRILGAAVGDWVRATHEQHGVVFHLGRKPARVEPDAVVLDDGTRLPCDLVVGGIGVRPRVELAQAAGLAVDNGIVVDEALATSRAGIWAAGDAARWPDTRTGERLRVEHWIVAERLGRTAARNILGRGERFGAVPVFWSQHYDTTITYLGHAGSDAVAEVEGSLDGQDAMITYRADGRVRALATLTPTGGSSPRNRERLAAEAAMERGREPAAVTD